MRKKKSQSKRDDHLILKLKKDIRDSSLLLSELSAGEFNIEKNKVTNVLVFAPNYVNVLEVNVELISGYPDVYQEFVNKKLGGLN